MASSGQARTQSRITFSPLTARRCVRLERWKSSRVLRSIRSSSPSTKPRASAACRSGMPRPRALSARVRIPSIQPRNPERRPGLDRIRSVRSSIAIPCRRRYPARHDSTCASKPLALTSAPTARSGTGSGATSRTRPAGESTRTSTSPSLLRGGPATNPSTVACRPGLARSAPPSMACTRAPPASSPPKPATRATSASQPIAVSRPSPAGRSQARASTASGIAAATRSGGLVGAKGAIANPAVAPARAAKRHSRFTQWSGGTRD